MKMEMEHICNGLVSIKGDDGKVVLLNINRIVQVAGENNAFINLAGKFRDDKPVFIKYPGSTQDFIEDLKKAMKK